MIICLMGPTASGKTALAFEIAKHFPCEIISVDSAMVYRGMDIGTAKPSTAERASVPHHLIDIRDPEDAYSAGDFRRDALQLIDDITARGKTPLLVGGTMLYFKALQSGIAELPMADPLVRVTIESRAETEGWNKLHAELSTLDPVAAARINPNDSQRIARALEVFYVSGKTLSAWHQENAVPASSHPFVNIALMPADRAWLHERIAKRLDQMMAAGFMQEVEKLMQQHDLKRDLPSMRSVGYQECWSYLCHEITYDTMLDKIRAATRQLAKRQMTWLRSWPELKLLEADQPQIGEHVVSYIRSLR
jgi:tRNA dimethylallyltransferase